MAVRMSIRIPFIDRSAFRALKYSASNARNTKKQRQPSNILTGYATGYLAISWNETIVIHSIKQTSPNAPEADKPKDIAEVAKLQCVLTVFVNSKQKPAEIIKHKPNKVKAGSKPSNNSENIN